MKEQEIKELQEELLNIMKKEFKNDIQDEINGINKTDDGYDISLETLIYNIFIKNIKLIDISIIEQLLSESNPLKKLISIFKDYANIHNILLDIFEDYFLYDCDDQDDMREQFDYYYINDDIDEN